MSEKSPISPASSPPKSAPKVSEPPKSAPKTSSPPRPVPPKPKPKSKGGMGFFSYLLIVIILLSGGVYFAYQQPSLRPHIEAHVKTYWEKLRANIASRMSSSKEDTSTTAKKPVTVTIAKRTPEPKPAPTPSPAPVVSSSNAPGFASEIKEIKDAVARLQIGQGETSRRLDSLDRHEEQDLTGLHISMIDLRLRHSGDTSSAAAELSKLSNAPNINPQWLAKEITRLQNSASRERIASILQKLLRLHPPHEAPPAAATELEGVSASLAKLFNVRRVDESVVDDTIRETLLRMELLFLTGQRAAYLHELEGVAVRSQHSDPNVALHFQTLQNFGAPEYFLAEQKP